MVEVPARVELAGGSDAPQVQLAIYCSMAVILDPALIRSARLRLALLDVRAETDLWFGPLIEHRSKQGLVLDASVLEWLRERLVDSGKLEEAAALMFEEHRHLGPSLRLEERLTHEALKGTSGDDLERLAAEALKAMKDKERRVLTRWADRAIDRLPQAARELSSTRAMKQAIAA